MDTTCLPRPGEGSTRSAQNVPCQLQGPCIQDTPLSQANAMTVALLSGLSESWGAKNHGAHRLRTSDEPSPCSIWDWPGAQHPSCPVLRGDWKRLSESSQSQICWTKENCTLDSACCWGVCCGSDGPLPVPGQGLHQPQDQALTRYSPRVAEEGLAGCMPAPLTSAASLREPGTPLPAPRTLAQPGLLPTRPVPVPGLPAEASGSGPPPRAPQLSSCLCFQQGARPRVMGRPPSQVRASRI